MNITEATVSYIERSTSTAVYFAWAIHQSRSMSAVFASRELCKALPKVELHAHLNGSCRDSTLQELAQGNQEITHDSAHLLSEKGTLQPSLSSYLWCVAVGACQCGEPRAHATPQGMGAGDRTLADCFNLFDIIHKVTTSTDVVTRITVEVFDTPLAPL